MVLVVLLREELAVEEDELLVALEQVVLKEDDLMEDPPCWNDEDPCRLALALLAL